MRIDQVIPSLASRDAIGQHTVALMRALRESGVDSDIFYGTCTPDLQDVARPMVTLGRTVKDRYLLYQSSIGSPVFDQLMMREEPKLVNYHNITPGALVEEWEPQVGFEVRLGRAQLERLVPHSLVAVADSGFNAGELEAMGCPDPAVVPLLIDMTTTGEQPDRATAERLAKAKADGGADLLFVGKVSPHKASHDLVKVLAVYRRLFDPRARLHLVGSALGRRYLPALLGFVEELGLGDAVSITGSVPAGALEAYYRSADVFVCASDHEGFCVPIVEAMGRGVPVVAFGSTAVPETVGDAGIVLDSKEPLRFAAAVARVIADGELRRHMVDAGAARVRKRFSLERSRDRFVAVLRDRLSA